ILLPLRPHPHVAVLFNLDVDDVRAATDGAILDVLLARPCRQVNGHDDLLAAGIAGVAGLVLHRSAPDPLHPVAHALQHRSQPVPLVALNLDDAILDRPARATAILQVRGELEQARFIERNIGYSRHTLAPPALRLPTEPDHRGALAGHFILRHGRL